MVNTFCMFWGAGGRRDQSNLPRRLTLTIETVPSAAQTGPRLHGYDALFDFCALKHVYQDVGTLAVA